MEEPEGCVRRVVQALLLALREHVRDESIANVMGEGAKDPARLPIPAGRECQAFETDHRVAAPVGEPVITGDHASDLVAGGACAGGVLDAADRLDQKLGGGKNPLPPPP